MSEEEIKNIRKDYLKLKEQVRDIKDLMFRTQLLISEFLDDGEDDVKRYE